MLNILQNVFVELLFHFGSGHAGLSSKINIYQKANIGHIC